MTDDDVKRRVAEIRDLALVRPALVGWEGVRMLAEALDSETKRADEADQERAEAERQRRIAHQHACDYVARLKGAHDAVKSAMLAERRTHGDTDAALSTERELRERGDRIERLARAALGGNACALGDLCGSLGFVANEVPLVVELDDARAEVERLKQIIASARYCVDEDVGSAALRATLDGNGLEPGVAAELQSDLDRLRAEVERLRDVDAAFGSHVQEAANAMDVIYLDLRAARAQVERLATIVDEAFGTQPVMSAESLLSLLEQRLFADRQEVERLRAAGDALALYVAYYGGIGMPDVDQVCNACDQLLDRGHQPTCALEAWFRLRGGSASQAVRTYLATRTDGPRVVFDDEEPPR